MGKLKLGIIITAVLFFGILIGSAGSKSSSTGKVKQSLEEGFKEGAKQSTSQSEEEKLKEQSEPLKKAGKVEVKSHSKRANSYGGYKVIGEVINNGQKSASNIRITATFYDADGGVVATESDHAGDTWDVPLQPGKTAPFEIVESETDFDHYKLDVVWD